MSKQEQATIKAIVARLEDLKFNTDFHNAVVACSVVTDLKRLIKGAAS